MELNSTGDAGPPVLNNTSHHYNCTQVKKNKIQSLICMFLHRQALGNFSFTTHVIENQSYVNLRKGVGEELRTSPPHSLELGSCKKINGLYYVQH